MREIANTFAVIEGVRTALVDFEPDWYPSDASDLDRRLIRVTLAHGLTGWALFFAYDYLAHRREEESHAALTLLERALDEASELPVAASLLEGVAGLAWTICHLRRIGFPLPDTNIDRSVDEYIMSELDEASGAYPEYAAGAVGIGIYALERDDATGERILETVLDRIQQTALWNGDRVSWFIRPEQLSDRNRRKGNDGFWDLGIAHGNPGIGLFLLAALPHCRNPERVLELVRGLAGFLLANELHPEEQSRFPDFVLMRLSKQSPSRLAWCYGDLGVSLFLVRAGYALGDDALVRKGLEIAHAAAVRPDVSCRIYDACFCHGAAGVSQLFKRLAVYDPALESARRKWLDCAVRMHTPGEGVAGYAFSYDVVDFDGSVEHTWVKNPGLLLGAAGIGLTLVSATSDVDPAWDRLFLLS